MAGGADRRLRPARISATTPPPDPAPCPPQGPDRRTLPLPEHPPRNGCRLWARWRIGRCPAGTRCPDAPGRPAPPPVSPWKASPTSNLDTALRRTGSAPILGLFGASRTMDINALVISGSDPGAVPGGSTKILRLGIMGPKQDRRTSKGVLLCLGEVPPLSVRTVQLQTTIVLRWLWLRKQSAPSKSKPLRLAA